MDSSNIHLRDYRDEDIPRMLFIIKTAFAEYRGFLDPPSSAERKTLAILTAELDRSDALVVEVDGSVIGCVLFRQREGGIYFERLSVLLAYRNRGFAHLMLTEIERRATIEGERFLWLSVRLNLTRLQDFYKDCGFVFHEFGTHPGYDQPTYMKMRKYLTPKKQASL